MSKAEFYKWLETCPTHKFEVGYEADDAISVDFRICEDEEESEEDEIQNKH